MAADWLSTQAAAWLAGSVLDHLSVRARSRLTGSDSHLALLRTYETAINVFISELPTDVADYADALERFFRSSTVCAELSVLLEPDSLATPDVANLRSVLVASGFDFSTAPNFSFEAVVARMSDAFIRAAAQDHVLRPIL